MSPTIVLDARTATDHFPGIGRYVVNLARALAQVAPDLELSLLHDPSAKSARLALPDLPRIACPVSPFSLQQQWQVPARLRHAQATLYHSPYYLMPYWPGVPTVFTCHDLIPLIYPQHLTATQRLIYRLTHVLALRTAQVTLAVSEATRADLLRFFRIDPQRIVVIHEAADEHFALQPPEAIAAVKRKYALPEIPLVIAGHWDDRYPEAKRLVEEGGMREHVIFTGPVDEADVPALYSGTMLFVFPSLYDGFGLPVLEAMACGTPVVCSNTSSLPEVAGDTAILINPMDIAALTAAISRVIGEETLRQHVQEKGLAQAAKFSWGWTARQTLTLYEQAARSK